MISKTNVIHQMIKVGAQWLIGRVLDSRAKGGGGARCPNAQKRYIIKTYQELILYKPVGKYQFTMAYIRALVMIVYQVINCLISQPKHMLWLFK